MNHQLADQARTGVMTLPGTGPFVRPKTRLGRLKKAQLVYWGGLRFRYRQCIMRSIPRTRIRIPAAYLLVLVPA